MNAAALALLWAAAYLLGAVPFGLLVGRAAGMDPRRYGSGNIGATNVARVSGWLLGLATLALDVGKGALAVWAASRLSADPAAPAGAALASVLGHVFPVFLRFRGGRGVATAAGAFAVLSPLATLAAGVLFVLFVGASRYVSLGSIGAALCLPFLSAWLSPGALRVEAAALCGLLVLLRHRDNLRRLCQGTENRLGKPRT